MNNYLTGKSAIITGASQGLGLEIAKTYARCGANLFMIARNKDGLDDAIHTLSAQTNNNQKICAMAGDVSKSSDITKVVKAAFKEFETIDILVNNAGVYGPMGPIDEIDWEDWMKSIEINLFGSILMARELIKHFKQKKKGKIIQLSGGGATNPMPCLSSYAVSKSGIVRFVETLAQEVKAYNIDINAIAPGALNTRLLDEVLTAGPDKVGTYFYEKSRKQKSDGGSSFEPSINLAVFLGSDKSDGITGKLISAIWDKWEEWPQHLEELEDSDIYTLRRITGRDRGKYWGDK